MVALRLTRGLRLLIALVASVVLGGIGTTGAAASAPRGGWVGEIRKLLGERAPIQTELDAAKATYERESKMVAFLIDAVAVQHRALQAELDAQCHGELAPAVAQACDALLADVERKDLANLARAKSDADPHARAANRANEAGMRYQAQIDALDARIHAPLSALRARFPECRAATPDDLPAELECYEHSATAAGTPGVGPPVPAAPGATPVPPTYTAGVRARGPVHLMTRDGRDLPLSSEPGLVIIQTGDRIVTGEHAKLELLLPDGTTFYIGPGSEMELDAFVFDDNDNDAPRKVIIRMVLGLLRWTSSKLPRFHGAERAVWTPHASYGIRGTDFQLTIRPDGNGSLALYDGRIDVNVKASGQVIPMKAGQIIFFLASGEHGALRALRPEERVPQTDE